MAFQNEIGKKGEKEAVRYLLACSYKVIATNYRYCRFEIDIIAEKKNNLVFVEVKTRSSNQYGYPEKFLSTAQEKRIAEAALYYIEEKNITKEIRFDVIAITKGGGLKHIKDAFFPVD